MKNTNEIKISTILSNPEAFHVVRCDDGYIVGVFVDEFTAAAEADDLSRHWRRRFVAQPNK